MTKGIYRRKGGLRISRKGKVSFSPGSMRVGGSKAGINLSKRGVSGSIRTPIGSANSRSGCRLKTLMLILPVMAMGIALLFKGLT